MISGAEGFEFAAGVRGHDGGRIAEQGGFKKLPQPVEVEVRHVAGEDQAPTRTVAEGGLDATHGTAAGVSFGQTGPVQVGVAFGRANQMDRTGHGGGDAGDALDERPVDAGQQGLVAAHAGTIAPREHVGGDAHETILAVAQGLAAPKVRQNPICLQCMARYNQYNKLMAFCFSLALTAAATAGEPASRVVTTVRADAKTGRLVRRSVVVSHKAVNKGVPPKVIAGPASQPAIQVGEIVDRAAKANDMDPLLVHSVIQVESNYNPLAVSPKGAEGLMQLIPATARRFGAVNSFDAEENITAGVKYLKYLKERFKDDSLALAAYNAGEGAVQKYGRVPPYKETEQYVEKVGQTYGAARRQQAPPVVAAPAAPQPEPLRHLEVTTDAEGRMVLKTR